MHKKCFNILIMALVFTACEEILTEENISDKKVMLLAPANEVNLPTLTNISFSWETVDQATEYKLQVATPSFVAAQQIVLDTFLTINTFSLDSLAANNYEWRVKAMNSGYETGFVVHGFVVE